MKKTTMEFPFIKNNYINDGTEHEIKIQSIKQISNLNLYLMDYIDYKKRIEFYSLIHDKNGYLTSLTLKNYSEFRDFMIRKEITFNEIELESFLSKYPNIIKKSEPKSSLKGMLKEVRQTIKLSIDENNNISFKEENRNIILSDEQLLEIIKDYDIIWINSNNEIIKDEDIINNVLVNKKIKEELKIEDIHHYVINKEKQKVKRLITTN